MNSATNLYHLDNVIRERVAEKNSYLVKFPSKKEREILKAFLLGRLHKLLCELFHSEIQDKHNYSMECYIMDSKIIQLLIQGIIETGEYTLEGIAYYTRIPFDVIYDAACGISNQFSITPWAKVVDLYIQVNPDIAQIFIDKLIEIKDKSPTIISALLNEA